ncbi:MAG: CHASE2 domain-containing protein [Cyanobacteria bacterium P01_F01_bin.150]
MTKNHLVVIQLEGDLETNGFTVTLAVSAESPFNLLQFPTLSRVGQLPSNGPLAAAIRQWQQDYGELTQFSRKSVSSDSNRNISSRALTPYKIQVSGSINPLIDICQETSQSLATLFKQWLHTESFLELEAVLRGAVDRKSAVRVLIQTSVNALHLLPWHQWSFIEDYPNAEVAIGAREFEDHRANDIPSRMAAKVNILAILGNSDNIDVGADEAILNSLPGARVQFLVQPSRQEFTEHLHDQPWDILFFAGHSDTENGEGIIQLNQTRTLTISEIEYGVKEAIAQGLQLAIFNSCNGLGLAHALSRLQLPQMIVMREALPDHVAHEFLKSFLKGFANGLPFYQAEREARQRLQALEDEFPCASWLPLIYQHPAKMPPSWRSLRYPSPSTKLSTSLTLSALTPIQKLTRLALASFVVTSVVMGIRFLGGWQPLEFWAFNSLMQWKSPEPPDDRLLLITINETDVTYQNNQGYRRDGSLSNQALADLLTILTPHNPAVIGIDIVRDRPLAPDIVLEKTVIPTFFVCKGEVRSLNDPATSAPKDVPLERLGFSDAADDPDRRVRRQPIGMSPAEGCDTDKSLSYQLARFYLHKVHRIEDRLNPQGRLVISDRTFPQLRQHQGPYHRASMGGYEVLLNYRRPLSEGTLATTISLESILSGAVEANQLEEWVRDRIILIGTTARSFNDYSLTPLGDMAGVELHGQMVSQIISAVLDDRPLLTVWPQWGDALWIMVWTMGAGGLAIYFHRRYGLMLAAAGTLCSLSGLCWVALNLGLWLPLMPTAIACTAVMAILQHQYLIPIPDWNRS